MSLVATPAEAKVLAEIDAGLAAGHDVFGDNDDDSDDGTTATDGTTADGADGAGAATGADGEAGEAGAAAGADDGLTEEALADVLDETIISTQPAHQFTAQVPTDYKEQRATLTTEKAQALKKLMDGEIDADEYAAIETRVSEAISDLESSRIRAETLIEVNIQNEAAFQQGAIKKLIAATKSEVDYAADPKAQKQFDTALNTLLADPDNAGKDYTELLTDAHRVVAAVRGIQTATPPATTTATTTAPRRPNVAAPVTLRNIPAAATPNANGDINDQLGRLKGQDFEAAFDKLSPAQKRAMLDD